MHIIRGTDTDRVEYLRHLFGVDAAIVGNVALTALVHIEVAYLALQTLLDQAVEQRTAVVAEREPLVVVHDEPVRDVHVETGQLLVARLVFHSRTFGDD